VFVCVCTYASVCVGVCVCVKECMHAYVMREGYTGADTAN